MPRGRIRNPNSGAADGTITHVPPSVSILRSQTYRAATYNLIFYYDIIGCNLTSSSNIFNPRIRDFCNK